PFCCVPSAEVCNGKDDDCNGIADDGLLNACGKCDGSGCNEVTIDNLSDCSAPGRSCTQIQPFELDPSAITLAQGPAPALSPQLWGAYPGSGMNGPGHVISIDINNGTVIKNITAPLGGHTPSELVTELDGSVWVLYTVGFSTRSPTEHFDKLG